MEVSESLIFINFSIFSLSLADGPKTRSLSCCADHVELIKSRNSVCRATKRSKKSNAPAAAAD